MYNQKNQFKISFGTDGWRGIIDSEINDETISVVARAFVDYLFSKDLETYVVAVAYDGRKKSKHLAEKFSQVLSASKIDVKLSNRVTPTPVLSYYVKNNNLSAGVMITASHNPPQYNGVKFKASYGGPFFTEETKQVKNFLYLRSYSYDSSRIECVDMIEPYFHHINSLIDFEKIRDAKLFPLIDSMGGAGQNLIQQILEKNQITAKTIFETCDENFFNRQPEPISKNLKPLSETLQQNKGYSIGLATDGDADRVGVMLENGEWLSTQEVILYLIDYIVNVKKISGHIVKTSSVTDKVFKFQNESRKIFDVQVGFKYICEKMINEDIAIGCEESGGFGIKYHIPERDGIFSALMILEMLANSGFNKMSQFVDQKRKEFGRIFYDRIDMEFDHPDRTKFLPMIKKIRLKKLLDIKL